MKCKYKSILLLIAAGMFFHGCASGPAEDNSSSEVNEESVGSADVEEANNDENESYDEYSGSWTTDGVSYHSVIVDGGTALSVTVNGNNLQGSMYSVQGITQRIAEINDIVAVIENGVCRYEFQDDGQGDSGTLYILFSEDKIEINVEDFVMADENLTGFAISGVYTLLRAAESEPDADIPETDTPETSVPNEVASDWGEIYYERYYKIWDSEEMMLAEIENRSEYRDNCSFYSDAVYYIEGGGGEFMLKTDISSLVEPLYPSDLVYMEEEDFKDYPPILLHILKNEIYARHGYIFQNEDLNNYFRGMIWYTPQYAPGEFDVSVFGEVEVHNLDILARLDTY